MKTHTEKFLRRRRFYIVLPLLVIPFVTLAFWALGGGQGQPLVPRDTNAGLKLDLPDAYFDANRQEADKFALYEQAKKDSAKNAEINRNDPYYITGALQPGKTRDDLPSQGNKKINASLAQTKYSAIDKDAALLNQKVEQLTFQLNQPATSESINGNGIIDQSASRASHSEMSPDIDRLEKLMQSMSDGSTIDPEIQQVDGLLEKILDVQHPDRVKDKIREQSIRNQSQVLPVTNAAYDDPITLISSPYDSYPVDSIMSKGRRNELHTPGSFYGLEGEPNTDEKDVNAIDAAIHETQTVVAGSIIKLRLLSPVFIQGQWISKGQFVYGVCTINGERLNVNVTSIRNDNALYPVALSVYDLDGMEGINIPGAISRDAAKQATSQSIQDVQLYSMNNSLGVQAAAAGMEAAKGLFSKKAKLIKVSVKAGYRVLLRDSNQRNNN